MALSQNEDFTIWYLRTAYLNNVKDGVAERLINVNSSVLNTPGFRAAGWSAGGARQTHSPPIPTSVPSQYFQPGAGLFRQESLGNDGDDDEGGMVTGRRSNDTVGPGLNVKRRRRKEQIEDDDSSDLSDDSDDEDDTRAAQKIKFPKMPARERADSSPIRHRDGKSQTGSTAISPPKPEPLGRRRGSSLGTVEAVKARARADTATSSDMSSENDVDVGYFRRRQLRTRRPTKTRFMEDDMIHEDDETGRALTTVSTQDDFDAASIDSDLSSDLDETAESASLLGDVHLATSSPELSMVNVTDAHTMLSGSPKKPKVLPLISELPPPRPISFIQPTSLLSRALNAQRSTPTNPVQRFATLSGKGSLSPLWIRIFVPSSAKADFNIDMPLLRVSKTGAPVIVAEAIGLALWRYCEDEVPPSLKTSQLNVNRWSLRMVEDGEVDFDFPALQRTKPMTDFTSNNNRGARGRSREKPYDEFALVEASEREFEHNSRETPTFSPAKADLEVAKEVDAPSSQAVNRLAPPPLRIVPASPRPNLLVAGQPFGSALTDRSVTPADTPAPMAARSTPRIGVAKTIRIRYFEVDGSAQSTSMELSIDSYIAEIMDHVCKKWNFDPALFVLKVAGTNTVAPLDGTVDVLGPRSDLELVRKRFVGAPAASPGSSSPSAPLFLDISGPKRYKRTAQPHPLAQKEDLMTSAMNYKKYYVTRKQLTSFTQNTSRVLIFDGDFLLNMPADKAFDTHAKTNSFLFMDVTKCKVSSKHSKLVRLFIKRSAEVKRYDFEARTSGEAQEIAAEVNKEMQQARTS